MLGANGEPTNESLFLECHNDCFLTQHVSECTRQRGSDEPSLLDLILSNEPGMIGPITHLSPIGKSDHHVLIFDIICYAQFTEPQIRFAYNRGDYNGASSFLSKCIWDGDDVNCMWNSCMSNLISCRDNFVPTFKASSLPVWNHKGDVPLDPSTRKLILEKTRA